MAGLPAHEQSPIQVVLINYVDKSQRANHYTTQPPKSDLTGSLSNGLGLGSRLWLWLLIIIIIIIIIIPGQCLWYCHRDSLRAHPFHAMNAEQHQIAADF